MTDLGCSENPEPLREVRVRILDHKTAASKLYLGAKSRNRPMTAMTAGAAVGSA